MQQKRQPVLFVGHGSPMNAIEDNRFTRVWEDFGTRLEKPKAILSISAHWFVGGTKVCTASDPQQIYDMYGFPDELYRLSYPAKGSPSLAKRVQEVLGDAVSVDNSWGIDHGSWSVLCRMFPRCDVPVVQVSVDRQASAEQHYALGKALAPLRDEGILIMGSGNVVHNLRAMDWHMEHDGYAEAIRFDKAIEEAVTDNRMNDIVEYRSLPGSALAVPIPDHYDPLLYSVGAAEGYDNVEIFNRGTMYGTLSMTSYLFF